MWRRRRRRRTRPRMDKKIKNGKGILKGGKLLYYLSEPEMIRFALVAVAVAAVAAFGGLIKTEFLNRT